MLFVFLETERPFAKKKKGLLANVLGEIDINSIEEKKILNQKSRNMGELQLVSYRHCTKNEVFH